MAPLKVPRGIRASESEDGGGGGCFAVRARWAGSIEMLRALRRERAAVRGDQHGETVPLRGRRLEREGGRCGGGKRFRGDLAPAAGRPGDRTRRRSGLGAMAARASSARCARRAGGCRQRQRAEHRGDRKPRRDRTDSSATRDRQPGKRLHGDLSMCPSQRWCNLVIGWNGRSGHVPHRNLRGPDTHRGPGAASRGPASAATGASSGC